MAAPNKVMAAPNKKDAAKTHPATKAAPAAPKTTDHTLSTLAPYAVLIEAETGMVLLDKNADQLIAPAFFTTFNTPLARGRPFRTSDTSSTLPVTIVNATFARTFFPTVDPIGRRIRLGGAEGGRNEWLTVVGVTPTLLALSLRDPWPPDVEWINRFRAGFDPGKALFRDSAERYSFAHAACTG